MDQWSIQFRSTDADPLLHHGSFFGRSASKSIDSSVPVEILPSTDDSINNVVMGLVYCPKEFIGRILNQSPFNNKKNQPTGFLLLSIMC